MKTHTPIIAAVDFSSTTRQVLIHSAKLATSTGRGMLVVHVISEGHLRDWEETMGKDAGTADRVREVTQHLREIVADHCGDVPAAITVRVGKPFRVLDGLVGEQGADLLVLGAHDVSKRRLGSVSSQCARSLPADVLILRDWQGQTVRQIAACVDFSPSSAVGLGRAIEIAEAHGASLEIIHVIYPPSRDPWGRLLEPRKEEPEDYEKSVRIRAAGRMEEFLVPFSDRLAGVRSSTVMLDGEDPSAVIAAHVEVGRIDLVVVGSHGGSWIEEFVLGSNAERLLQDSASSVLIARERIP